MKKNGNPKKTFIRIIKAFIFGMASGMILLQYVRNKKRPVLALCGDEKSEKNDMKEDN